MAKIPTFDARAPRGGQISGYVSSGAVESWSAIASAAGQISGRLGQMADKAAVAEEIENASIVTPQVSMPGVDFAFDGRSPGSQPAPGTGQVETYIRAAAAKRGIDPDVAVRVARSEGLAEGVWQSNVVKNGKRERSYGPFQLYVDGGLGNEFEKRTGKSAADPSTVNDQIDFALDKAIELGWSPWYGAAKVGVGARDGLPGSRPAATPAGASTIDRSRPILENPDGSFSTEETITIYVEVGGKHKWVNIPTIVGGKRVGEEQAVKLFEAGSNKAVGEYDTLEAAEAAARDRSQQIGEVRANDRTNQGSGVSVTMTGAAGPMPRKTPGTLRGDAFNAAAGQIYMNRLDTSMRATVDALEIQYGDDPAALDQALRASHAGFVADLPPAARAEFDASFEARRVSAISSSVKRAQARVEDNLLASYDEKIAARKDTAIRLAINAGADPAADQRIASELEAIAADIDASPMSPLAKSRELRNLEKDVIRSRVLGGFDQQAGPAERAAYLERFQEEWKAGEGFGGRVAAEDYERITSSMVQAIQRDEVQAQKRIKEIDGAIKSQTSYLEKGLPVPPEVRQTMAQAVAQTGDEQLGGRMDFFDRLSEWQKAHVGARPEVLDAQISALEGRIATEGATEAAMTTLGVMTGLRKQMETGLAQDPLGWAANAGLVQVAPLDVSTAESFTASLAGRVSAAQAVASHYDVAPVYFRPAEKAALIKAADKDPLMLPQMAGSMIAAFGDETPRALAELSADAPVIAHIADLQHRTGDQGLTVEAAEALAMRKAEGYKSSLPGPAKIQSAATPMLGPALSHAPKAANAALETATALFEYRAVRRGIDTSKVDDPADPAHELFMDALDASVGGRTVGGVKMGGFATVNGRQTIAPEDMPADQLEVLVNGLTGDDLINQQEIVSANGVAIRPADIAGGMLVYAGPGRYHVALGDPSTGDPRFIGTREGRRWTLDVGLLRATSRGWRKMGWYR